MAALSMASSRWLVSGAFAWSVCWGVEGSDGSESMEELEGMEESEASEEMEGSEAMEGGRGTRDGSIGRTDSALADEMLP